MSFDSELTKVINSKRNIRDSSMKAYISNLNKLLSMNDSEKSISNLNTLLKNPDKVIELLNERKNSTIRNYLASIVVYVNTIDDEELLKKYRELMEEYGKEYVNHLKENQKSPNQDKNWTSLKSLTDVLKDYKKQIDKQGLLKKDELTKKEMDLLQKYVVGMLYIGDETNPPLRNDYIMEIISEADYKRLSEAEKKKKNYLVVKNRNTKYFSIGEYKTSGKYGIKEFPIGKSLNKVLNYWLKYNKSKHLLLNSKNEPMSANGLTKYIQKVFEPTGKKIGASMLRHIYITEKINPMTKQQKELADKMLHSTGVQQGVYNKDD